MILNRVFIICILILFLTYTCESRKRKCSRRMRRVPMQRNFDMKQFAGTWYTVSRTTHVFGENTYESGTIEFSENPDGSYTYALTGQLNHKCLPVESGKLEVGQRNAQFLMKGESATNEYPTMVVSYTNYEVAMVYYCFRYRPGRKDQCQRRGMQVEIMSRSPRPKRKTIKDYMKRVQKRLCVSPKDMETTKQGVCKLPDILAQVKDRDVKPEDLIDDTKKKHCAVNNIPVKKKFHLSQNARKYHNHTPQSNLLHRGEETQYTNSHMTSKGKPLVFISHGAMDWSVMVVFLCPEMEGLWYEIARTRFTFNKMESVISYHRYDPDDNLIKSYYTGTTNGNCSTPIKGTSRTFKGSKHIGNMEGKIDGDIFVWSPLKILYIDDNYLMFYACYSGASEFPCVQEAMEVTLVGRTRQITEENKTDIYSILPKICVSPTDMIDTVFAENCTEWVENVIHQRDTDPSSCALDEIPAYPDYDDISMLGEWFLYGHVNYSDSSLIVGNILNISRGPADSLIFEHAEYSIDSCFLMNRVYIRQRCLDTGEYITTLPDEKEHGFVFSKILYQGDNSFVYYVCSQRTLDGRCSIDGVQAFVYTRNQTMTDNTEEQVNKALKLAHINPSDLVITEGWCDTLMFGEIETEPEDDACDIDIIRIFHDIEDFNQVQLYGYWYEIAHSVGIHNGDLESSVAYFTSDNNITLQIYYSGIYDDGTEMPVQPVERITAIPRCQTEVNGDYLTETPHYIHNSNVTSFTPMKVLFTDYNILLTFICQEMLPNGKCSEDGSHIRLWSRDPTMDNDTREYVIGFAYWACIDPKLPGYLVNTTYDDAVRPKLEEYVEENVHTVEYQEVDSDEEERERNEQPVDGFDTYYDAFDEMQKYFDMDDDAFYNLEQ